MCKEQIATEVGDLLQKSARGAELPGELWVGAVGWAALCCRDPMQFHRRNLDPRTCFICPLIQLHQSGHCNHPPSRLRAAAVLGSCCHCLLVHVVSLLHPFASSWSASQRHQTFHQPLQNAYGRRGKKQENTEESLGAGWRQCNGSQRELCHAGAMQTRGSQPWDSVARLSICPHHGWQTVFRSSTSPSNQPALMSGCQWADSSTSKAVCSVFDQSLW